MRRIAAALLALAAPAAAQEPRIEPVLVELRLARMASRTIPAHRIRDEALIPVLQLFELAEIRTERRPDGTVVAILQPGNRKVTLDPAQRRIEVSGRRRALAQDEFLTDGELFVSASVLTQTLGIRFEISWNDLEVLVANPEELPIGRRYRRAALAAARLALGDSSVADGRLAERRAPVEGLIADYSLLVPTSPGPKSGAYSLTMGFSLLDGAFLAGVQNEGSLDDGKARIDLSWTGVWRDNDWLSQIRLGDGYASGPRTRALRGVSLGNVPFRRPAILGQLPFGQTLGPGWEIEAYRGGRLISFDSVNALGQFSLDVPIQYGENPVDFIAYGPFGEVREFNRTYRVTNDVIPAGRFEYALSLGACRRDAPCSATGNLDLRVGVNQRITAFAGYDRFWRDTLPDLSHPYAGIVAGLSNAVVAEAECVGSARARLGGSFQAGQVRLIPAVRWNLTEPETAPSYTRTTWGLNAIALPVPTLGSFVGSITSRAGVEFDTPIRAQSGNFFLSRPLTRFLRLEVGSTWLTGQRPTFMAIFTADLPQARAYTSVQRTPAGSASATQFIQGSVLYDGASERVVLNAGPSAQQSGISGRVFMDRNQNGRYDSDDYVLPDVEVTVGLFSQRTDRRGEYRIWPLPAYDPIVAAVDTATLASPLWLPAFSGIELTPVPNRFSELNIPVLSGAVVEGRMVTMQGDSEVPVPGGEVILRHRASGRERRITTFRDGSFYALSIRPGEWEVRVDPALLDRLGGRADPLEFSVPLQVEGATVSGLTLRIR